MKPEYLHAISNHVLVIGVGLGIFALVLALFLKSRQAQIVSLAVMLVSSAAAYPVLFLGQQAYKTVRGIADEPGQQWLDTHMERAESTIYIYYALMIVAGAALAVPKWKPKTAVPLALATLTLAAASMGVGGWISYAGGRVRHPEFRDGPPPGAVEARHQHPVHE
ncbi:hypothetical protein [Prosthecobacter sp.]|uniref:hypothetical protein n=1 Tax=Prosthecobacter sp. TaxID=1965333 RepID=UPI002488173D|nr:hypothetical protein [Prosthecobacter sp.]MDI1310534.1 hypothetical protein [Prosthecobacter sp.]